MERKVGKELGPNGPVPMQRCKKEALIYVPICKKKPGLGCTYVVRMLCVRLCV